MPVTHEAVPAAYGRLSELADRTRIEGPWASGAFASLADHGVLARLVPADCGGVKTTESAPSEPLEILTATARHCLTTALALSQWAAAVQIMAAADLPVRQQLLDGFASGRRCATIGISQLTTSRRHASRPPMVASRRDQWRLNGLCPWVTGADTVDVIVTGAVITEADAGYFVVERSASGVDVELPMRLVALSGSRTSSVRFVDVQPVAMISAERAGAPRGGGLATTAVAVGAALGSVDLLRGLASESSAPDLVDLADRLSEQCAAIAVSLADPATLVVDEHEDLRARANQLVRRASTAALMAAKGSGFIAGHPAGRAVSEAQFFTVWSNPPGVVRREIRYLTAE